MNEIIQDIRNSFSKIWEILSLDDALVTTEGKAFLSNAEKMEEFYKRLDNKEEKEPQVAEYQINIFF